MAKLDDDDLKAKVHEFCYDKVYKIAKSVLPKQSQNAQSKNR